MRDHTAVKGLQRAQLAERMGCHLETVRANGDRSYDTRHERRLRFVLRARELGFSLDEIRELFTQQPDSVTQSRNWSPYRRR